MTDKRRKEILSFFQYNKYGGSELNDMDFTEEEINKLNHTDYITCTGHNPTIYVLTIKAMRWLNGAIL